MTKDKIKNARDAYNQVLQNIGKLPAAINIAGLMEIDNMLKFFESPTVYVICANDNIDSVYTNREIAIKRADKLYEIDAKNILYDEMELK